MFLSESDLPSPPQDAVQLALMRKALIAQVGGGHPWPRTPKEDVNGIVGLLFPHNTFEEVMCGPISLQNVGVLLLMFATIPGERINSAGVLGNFSDAESYTSEDVQREMRRVRAAQEQRLSDEAAERNRRQVEATNSYQTRAEFYGHRAITSMSDYFDIVLAHADVFMFHSDGDYSGTHTFLLRSKIDQNPHRVGFLATGYGSCSSCDALESCGTAAERLDLGKTLVDSDTHWFEDLQKLLCFLQARDWQGCDPSVSQTAIDLAIHRCSCLLGLTEENYRA